MWIFSILWNGLLCNKFSPKMFLWKALPKYFENILIHRNLKFSKPPCMYPPTKRNFSIKCRNAEEIFQSNFICFYSLQQHVHDTRQSIWDISSLKEIFNTSDQENNFHFASLEIFHREVFLHKLRNIFIKVSMKGIWLMHSKFSSGFFCGWTAFHFNFNKCWSGKY